MTSRREFLKGVLTAVVAATIPRWLPDKGVISPEIPIGYVEVIGNTSYFFDKEIDLQGDVILLDGKTVHRPKNIKLLPGGIASICKTDTDAWAVWGVGIT